MRRIVRDEAGDGDAGERLLDFSFQLAPYFIGLAVAGLKTGQGALYRREEDLEWSVEFPEDFPDGRRFW